ncbi:glycosyl hydrolase [Conexibacter sp. JD483]|uniref:glycosyl hydrolase n=1 Tax=unclassified Conexibacter TaxID=2627773 RepID=UPI00272608EE|nr:MULTISPECIES: glycosyl hydrolase [unclassified Conexibacter]MDO8187260.1 glycosyl hydrolase [Conexibacter sp. CPCC 205706]MDO8198869.1 glycosyl hydrolase [Conexibacter sp. CPCC 205762]MDR9371861.1 glycosyl hydrolase [Conexibacter sp. JD483]
MSRWIPPRRPVLAVVLATATALGAATAASAPALAAGPQAPLDPLAQPQQFQSPGNAVRPQMRWWWGSLFFGGGGALTTAETRREIAAMDEAGFGSFEIAFGPGKWANAEQRDNLEAALEEARDRGMHVDMTIGAAWPVRTPNTAPGSGLSLQELQYGRAALDGGDSFEGPVPAPYDDAANSRGARLFAVTAAKVLDAGPAVTRVDEAPSRSTVLDPTSLIDLTADVDPSGDLSWTAPDDGSWIVFGFWQRDARQGVIDHFNDAAVDAAGRYVDDNQFTTAASRLLRDHGGSFFEDSLEINAEGLYWNDEMADQFERRRGYALRRLLPLFFQQGMNKYWVPQDAPVADFDLPGGDGERIRHDYYETLTDLYVEEHLQPFQDWASAHGVKFRTQAAFGQDLDVTRSARELAQMGGLPDDESLNAGDNVPYDQTGNRSAWRFALDHHRSVTGGAHQGGLNEVSSELGAVFGYAYQMNLGDYKGILDKEWAAGTTRATVHGYTYQSATASWPGDNTFADYVSDSWNSTTFPQWGDWRPLTDYWARGTSVLEAGTARADVALYRDGFVTTAAQGLGNQPVMRPLFDSENLERAGYAVEFLDPNGVLDPDGAPSASASEARAGTAVLYPRGPRYKAIVVDERSLPAAVAERLAVEAEQGLAVVLVGDLPNADTSYKNATRGDTRVRAAITRLLDAPKVARVGTQAEAAGALERLGVTPDAKWAAPAQLLTQHRETKTTDYYYLYNATDEAIAVDGSFASGGRPYALDLWTGAIDPVAAFAQAGGRTTIPLKVPALGTTVIAFRKGEAAPALHAVSASGGELVAGNDANTVELRDTSAGARSVTVADGSTRAATIPALPGAISPTSWRLHVAPEAAMPAAPVDLQLDALKDWRELPGLARTVGVGTYTTTLELPADWTAADRGAYLDLGAVSGSVRIALNGRAVAPDSVPGRRWDVSPLLKPGANELTVRVATTLRNAVPGIAMPYTSMRVGLLGPVSLVPFGRASVDLRTPVVTPPPVDPRPPVVTPPARRPSTKVTVEAAKSVRLKGLSGTGLLVKVTVPQRAKLALTLSAKLPRAKRATALARASRSTTKAATVSLRLKAGRAAVRKLKLALKSKRQVTATVAVKTTLSGGKPATKTLRITIRR